MHAARIKKKNPVYSFDGRHMGMSIEDYLHPRGTGFFVELLNPSLDIVTVPMGDENFLAGKCLNDFPGKLRRNIAIPRDHQHRLARNFPYDERIFDVVAQMNDAIHISGHFKGSYCQWIIAMGIGEDQKLHTPTIETIPFAVKNFTAEPPMLNALSTCITMH